MVKTKKSIIICSTSYHEYDRRLQRISSSLSRAGHKVSWISRSHPEVVQQKNSGQIRHLILETFFKSGPLFYLEYNLRLRGILKQYPSELVCSVDLDTVMGASWAHDKSNTKLVFDAHEIYYEVPELSEKTIKKANWKWVAKKYLPKIKTAYTVNNSLKSHYLKYGSEYGVIRNVPPSRSRAAVRAAKPKKNNKILIYLGVLNEGRGVELYIEAMKDLPEYQLWLIGEGDLSDRLRKLAGDNPAIKFLGYKQPDDIFDLLEQASVGLNLLRAESLNYKLSLANKFFDYMHAGLPSINMAYPEYLQIIEQDPVGLTISDYSISALISAVRSLEDNKTYAQLSAATTKAQALYNWEIEEQKLLSIYQQL